MDHSGQVGEYKSKCTSPRTYKHRKRYFLLCGSSADRAVGRAVRSTTRLRLPSTVGVERAEAREGTAPRRAPDLARRGAGGGAGGTGDLSFSVDFRTSLVGRHAGMEGLGRPPSAETQINPRKMCRRIVNTILIRVTLFEHVNRCVCLCDV